MNDLLIDEWNYGLQIDQSTNLNRTQKLHIVNMSAFRVWSLQKSEHC